jgi:hypothetical protein
MVGIDVAHAKLIEGLIVSFKPQNILEFGYGDGRSHNAICQGVKYNQNKPHYTLVDNWLDWNYQQPEEVHKSVVRHQLNHKTGDAKSNTFESLSVVTSDERSFVNNWSPNYSAQFDFIMSDADHQHSHEWAHYVYDKLLKSPGILIYHDVDGSYEGLGKLPVWFEHMPGNDSMVFNRSTREDEECKRGLLVIFKR